MQKYRKYVADRLESTKESIHETIKRTQLSIFKVKPKKKVNKDKMKLAAANMDSNLFCKLFIACGSRKGDVTDFFMHENSRHPPSLSEFGNLRQPAINDDLVNCLCKANKMNRSEFDWLMSVSTSTDIEVHASAVIMNAISLVKRAPPESSMTVKDYSENVFDKLINTKREEFMRVDVLFDVNGEKSLEGLTTENSEDKYVSWIDNDTKLQQGKTWFMKFLNNVNNKEKFMKVLSSNYVRSARTNDDNVLGIGDHIVISKDETADLKLHLPIENINTRMLLHVEDAVRNGHQRILLSTSDSDIVNVAIYAFKYLTPGLSKLWVEMVNDKNARLISIHELYELHQDKSDVLPFFNAFTGCRTTSSFFGIGKMTAWNTWMGFPSATSAMLQLMIDGTSRLSDEAMNVLEEFTIKMYDSTSKMTKLHECRRDLFTRKNKARTIDRIPPTRDALEQHVKRSILQAMVWAQCFSEY